MLFGGVAVAVAVTVAVAVIVAVAVAVAVAPRFWCLFLNSFVILNGDNMVLSSIRSTVSMFVFVFIPCL